MQIVALSRKTMILRLIVKGYASQSIANEGSKFPNEVSRKDVVAPDRQKGHADFKISAAETSAKTALGRG
jgi:hypothetical protein